MKKGKQSVDPEACECQLFVSSHRTTVDRVFGISDILGIIVATTLR